MNNIPCAFCAGKGELRYKAGSLIVERCPNCNGSGVNPLAQMASGVSIASIYPEEYLPFVRQLLANPCDKVFMEVFADFAEERGDQELSVELRAGRPKVWFSATGPVLQYFMSDSHREACGLRRRDE